MCLRAFLGSFASASRAAGVTSTGMEPRSRRPSSTGVRARSRIAMSLTIIALAPDALLTPGRQVEVVRQMHPGVDQRTLDLAVNVALAREVVGQVDIAGPELALFAVAQL